MSKCIILGALSTDILTKYVRACNKHEVIPIIVMKQGSILPNMIGLPEKAEVIHLEQLQNEPHDLLNHIATTLEINAVVAAGEFAVVAADFIARNLNLPCSMHDDALILRDKYVMRQKFHACGVEQPKLLGVATSEHQLVEVLEHIQNYPIITKPADMAGSWHVFLNATKEEALRNAVPVFYDTQSIVTGLTFSGMVLVEQFFSGQEYSAEVIVQNGEIVNTFINKKFLSPIPCFDEIGHLCGIELSEAHSKRLDTNIRNIIKAAKVSSSILHVEFKINSNGNMAIIEAGCRVAGDRISTIVDYCYGISLEETMLQLKLGKKVSHIEAQKGQLFGIRFRFHGINDILTPNMRLVQEFSEPPRKPSLDFSTTHIVNRTGYSIVAVSSEEDFTL